MILKKKNLLDHFTILCPFLSKTYYVLCSSLTMHCWLLFHISKFGRFSYISFLLKSAWPSWANKKCRDFAIKLLDFGWIYVWIHLLSNYEVKDALLADNFWINKVFLYIKFDPTVWSFVPTSPCESNLLFSLASALCRWKIIFCSILLLMPLITNGFAVTFTSIINVLLFWQYSLHRAFSFFMLSCGGFLDCSPSKKSAKSRSNTTGANTLFDVEL